MSEGAGQAARGSGPSRSSTNERQGRGMRKGSVEQRACRWIGLCLVGTEFSVRVTRFMDLGALGQPRRNYLLYKLLMYTYLVLMR